MKYPKDRLLPHEKEEILHGLKTLEGPKSLDVFELITTDKYGISHSLVKKAQGVEISGQGIPRVMSQEFTMILDCGHIAHSPDSILGKCDNGHLICNLHNLVLCVQCKKILCHRCANTNDDGNPICFSHHPSFKQLLKNAFHWFLYLLFGFVILLILIALFQR